MATWLRLNDLIYLTRARTKKGPTFQWVPFCVEQISHSLDLDRQTWTTQLTCSQVTTWMLGPVVSPPYPPPADI